MTQGRKRMAILITIILLLLAALWGYLAFSGRQSEYLGYLVRGNGYGIENVAEYEPERQTEGGLCYG